MRNFLVVIMVLAVAGFAFSQAVVKDTPHDLAPAAAGGTNQALQATAAGTLNNEICIYCHTPHGGSAIAPLWNRAQQPGATTYTKYNSSTMNAAQPSDAGIIASVSGACLSCHDGTVAVDNLLNVNGTAHAPSVAFTKLPAAKANYGNAGTGSNNIMTGLIPFLGTDLSNDHPITIIYQTAKTATPLEFQNVVAGPPIVVTGGGNSLPLYGAAAASATVECGSCHNPHNNTNTNFLRISNTGSAICYVCHIK